MEPKAGVLLIYKKTRSTGRSAVLDTRATATVDDRCAEPTTVGSVAAGRAVGAISLLGAEARIANGSHSCGFHVRVDASVMGRDS